MAKRAKKNKNINAKGKRKNSKLQQRGKRVGKRNLRKANKGTAKLKALRSKAKNAKVPPGGSRKEKGVKTIKGKKVRGTYIYRRNAKTKRMEPPKFVPDRHGGGSAIDQKINQNAEGRILKLLKQKNAKKAKSERMKAINAKRRMAKSGGQMELPLAA